MAKFIKEFNVEAIHGVQKNKSNPPTGIQYIEYSLGALPVWDIMEESLLDAVGIH